MFQSTGTLSLTNSIINNPGSTANCGGTVTLTGANVVFGGAPGTCAGSITTDPLLAALAANGGVTQTRALQTGSSAINAATGACPANDQRGFPRNVGACDLGAYEFNSVLPPDTTPPACAVMGVLVANPKQMDVSAKDVGHGLLAITNPVVSNGTIVVPYFLPGTTLPIALAAVKANQAQSTSWSFDAWTSRRPPTRATAPDPVPSARTNPRGRE